MTQSHQIINTKRFPNLEEGGEILSLFPVSIHRNRKIFPVDTTLRNLEL